MTSLRFGAYKSARVGGLTDKSVCVADFVRKKLTMVQLSKTGVRDTLKAGHPPAGLDVLLRMKLLESFTRFK